MDISPADADFWSINQSADYGVWFFPSMTRVADAAPGVHTVKVAYTATNSGSVVTLDDSSLVAVPATRALATIDSP